MFDWRTRCFVIAFMAACGGRTDSPDVATGDASSPWLDAPSAIPRTSEAGTFVGPASGPDIQLDPIPIPVVTCPTPEVRGPTATVACVGEVVRCDVSADGCTLTSFWRTMEKWLAPCKIGCATIDLGVTQGCVSDVTGRASSSDGPKAADPMECIRSSVLGHRWSCAGKDGWYAFTIGSCIIP